LPPFFGSFSEGQTSVGWGKLLISSLNKHTSLRRGAQEKGPPDRSDGPFRQLNERKLSE
jgi:hypothetical protein